LHQFHSSHHLTKCHPTQHDTAGPQFQLMDRYFDIILSVVDGLGVLAYTQHCWSLLWRYCIGRQWVTSLFGSVFRWDQTLRPEL